MKNKKIKKIYEQEIYDWSDDDLIEELLLRYLPTDIPKCRVCAGELSMQACGGGIPTKYAHVVHVNGKVDWEHYQNSEFEDVRRGGDELVIEIIKRFQNIKN